MFCVHVYSWSKKEAGTSLSGPATVIGEFPFDAAIMQIHWQ